MKRCGGRCAASFLRAPKLATILTFTRFVSEFVALTSFTSTIAYIQSIERLLNKHSVILTPIEDNLVDKIWTNRPSVPMTKVSVRDLKSVLIFKVFVHEFDYAGEQAVSKLERVGNKLRETDATIMVLTRLDEIACKSTSNHMTNLCPLGLLNLRANDTIYTPVFISYLTIKYSHANDATKFESGTLFVKQEKLTSEAIDHLKALNISTREYDTVGEDLRQLKNAVVYVDREYCNSFVYKCLEDSTNQLTDVNPPLVETLKVRSTQLHMSNNNCSGLQE